MARPLTRAHALQNRAFLQALRRTNNVRLACREAGAKYGTMQHRRRRHSAFALRWDAALAFAQARLRAPSPRSRIGASRPSPAEGGGFRTLAGEPHLVRLKDGTLQMRRAQPGKLTREAEQAFQPRAINASGN